MNPWSGRLGAPIFRKAPALTRREVIAGILSFCLVTGAMDPVMNWFGPRLPNWAGRALARCAASDYAAPALTDPVRQFYIDAATGNDGNPGTQAQPWLTIGRIDNSPQAGDYFYVRGTFTGVDVCRPLVSGTASAKCIITAWPGFANSIRISSDDITFWFDSASHWVLDGLTVESLPAVASDMAFRITNQSNIWIRNCTFRLCYSSWIIGNNDGVNFASDNRVEDCVFDQIGNQDVNDGDLLIGKGARNTVIVRNTFTKCAHAAITDGWYQSSGDDTAEDTIVAQNTIRNRWGGGVNVNGKSKRILIECNDISEGGVDSPAAGTRNGLLLQGMDGVVRYNRIWDCALEGVSFAVVVFSGFTQQVLRYKFYHNTIFRNGGAPIMFFVGNGASCTANQADNEIDNNVGWGNHTIGPFEAGHYFADAYQDIWIDHYNGSGMWANNSLNGNVFRNNHFARVASDPDAWWMIRVRTAGDGENLYHTKAQVEATFAGCSGNADGGDPQFVSEASTPNLRPRASSPLLNAGRVIAGVSYVGATPDIGVYEFVGGRGSPVAIGSRPTTASRPTAPGRSAAASRPALGGWDPP